MLAALALGGFLYSYAASQERERAREQAVLDEQETERHHQAAEEQEHAKEQAAQDQRDEEALKERIRDEEGKGDEGRGAGARERHPE